MTTYEARAEMGARILDRMPAFDGWDQRINRQILDMASFSKCVGGQLCGLYDAFARQIGMASRCEDEQAAFNPVGPDDAQQLTLAWIVLLEEREDERRLTLPARLLA